jgi:hypothetical protein
MAPRYNVIALSVQLCWVVQGEENVEDHVGRNDRFIEVDARDFCVTGISVTDGLIARVIDVSTHVTNFDVGYSHELHVRAI